ncbi:unnamed protein product [Triticum turgidum subsp. durum]|uniref:Protein XRI1 n=1 Tax=Triticum turgidum subsp. durum TaxID=4567 RepID=A0A9R0XA78_TRITD|nr:unnamed protein product [Triticum turgidum subsp. durum]
MSRLHALGSGVGGKKPSYLSTPGRRTLTAPLTHTRSLSLSRSLALGARQASDAAHHTEGGRCCCCTMETAQERELLQLQLQGWPFHAMPPSFDAGNGAYSGSGSSSMSSDVGGGDSFLLGWEQPFGGCFGLADAQLHDLFPLCMMEPLALSPAATSTAADLPSEQQVPAPAAMPNGELGDLLLNFWDAGDARERPVAINSGCVPPQHEKSSQSSAATATNSFLYDEDDLLGSIFSKRPTLAEEPPVLFLAPAEAEPLPSTSSSSSCHADPHASDAGGARAQDTTTKPSGARAPPLPRCSSSSLKRATPEASESAEAECSQSGGKRRKVSASVLCPFAVLKPDGLDGGATLADINARILMRPARPVRHPVGEYACAPRVLAADAPGISGRAVSGFTRLHTPGRGTITIMRTRG